MHFFFILFLNKVLSIKTLYLYLHIGNSIKDSSKRKIIMKIEVRNIQYFKAMSQETHAFVADLYVNGLKTAIYQNNGSGGYNDYSVVEGKKQLFLEAISYCSALPPVRKVFRGEGYDLYLTLELIIDDAIDVFVLNYVEVDVKKELQDLLLMIQSNQVEAWEEDLEDTKTVIIAENFNGVEYNGWIECLTILINKL